MSTVGKRNAIRTVLVLFFLLIAVVAGRQLVEPAPQASATPRDGAVLSTSDHGLVAVAARVPVPAQEARLDLGGIALVGTAGLLLLVWTSALAVGRGRHVLDTLGVRCRRRGPPAFLGL